MEKEFKPKDITKNIQNIIEFPRNEFNLIEITIVKKQTKINNNKKQNACVTSRINKFDLKIGRQINSGVEEKEKKKKSYTKYMKNNKHKKQLRKSFKYKRIQHSKQTNARKTTVRPGENKNL